MTRCHQKSLLTLVALLIWSTASVVVAQTPYVPTDDAYIELGTHSSADPDVIHGETDPDRLWVRAATTLDRRTFMKFDLSDLTLPVGEAILEFTADVAIGAPEVHYVYIYEVEDNEWSELELTGENAPSPGSELGVVEVEPQSSTDPDLTYEFDLTEHVNASLGDDGILSIALANPTAETGESADQTDVRIFSKEATLLGPGPQLVVTAGTGTSANRDEIPESFAVDQNYPNPFNPRTELRFEAPSAGHLEITVYNALGRRVATLFQGQVTAGEGSTSWDGRDDAGRSVRTGVYMARFDFAGQVTSISMTLLR